MPSQQSETLQKVVDLSRLITPETPPSDVAIFVAELQGAIAQISEADRIRLNNALNHRRDGAVPPVEESAAPAQTELESATPQSNSAEPENLRVDPSPIIQYGDAASQRLANADASRAAAEQIKKDAETAARAAAEQQAVDAVDLTAHAEYKDRLARVDLNALRNKGQAVVEPVDANPVEDEDSTEPVDSLPAETPAEDGAALQTEPVSALPVEPPTEVAETVKPDPVAAAEDQPIETVDDLVIPAEQQLSTPAENDVAVPLEKSGGEQPTVLEQPGPVVATEPERPEGVSELHLDNPVESAPAAEIPVAEPEAEPKAAIEPEVVTPAAEVPVQPAPVAPVAAESPAPVVAETPEKKSKWDDYFRALRSPHPKAADYNKLTPVKQATEEKSKE